LHIFGFIFQHAFGLLQVEKCAANFRRNTAPCRRQRLNRCLAPSACRLHPTSGREAIKDVPRCVYPDHSAVVEFRTNVGIALTVNFVSRERAHVWTCRAAVQNVLVVFDLDIFLPRLDRRTVRVSPRQAIIQVRVIGPILQFP
jgi:hypothetical protein